jgi:hypothetical protein
MVSDDTQMVQRDSEMRSLHRLADSYFIQNGRFPSRIRVGPGVARRLFPSGSGVAVTADFTIEEDNALPPEEVAFVS